MSFDHLLSANGISASGMRAERMRMELIANNIANANSTRTPEGGAYRRKDMVFEAVLDRAAATGVEGKRGKHLGGVRTLGSVDDQSEMPQVYNPGHPDANPEGFVTMPNVNLPIEMVNLVTATRAYEANLKAAQAFREMAEASFNLVRNS